MKTINIIKLLKRYQNGNYWVNILSDGTKTRQTEDDVFLPSFPESIDLKITNCCDKGCPMCHENSRPDGAHGDLSHPLIGTLQAGTELAIGGGNPLEHPNLLPFLFRLKEQGVIANMTVNQDHLENNFPLIEKMIADKLIYGIGISITNINQSIISFCQKYSNAVLHLIAGYHNLDFFKTFSNKGLKILILGYKQFGRGKMYYSSIIEDNIGQLEREIMNLANGFKIISFDNLALKQLKIQNKVAKEIWKKQYMGDDGQYTMYIDLVDETFAVSSTSIEREPLLNNVEGMFVHVKKVTLSNKVN